MKVLGWILLLGGLAILGVEFLQGEGISLIGAGVGAVGAVVASAAANENSQSREEER